MDLIPINSNPRSVPLFDAHTVKNIQCILTNIFFNKTSPLLIVANLPLRVYSCVIAYQEKSYWKIAFDVAAIACLLLFGTHIAIAVDCASLTVNLYLKYKDKISMLWEENDEFDCTIRTNALEVLGLSEADATDTAVLDRRYDKLCKCLSDRIKKAAKSRPLVKEITQLLKRVERSYQTLKNGI